MYKTETVNIYWQNIEAFESQHSTYLAFSWLGAYSATFHLDFEQYSSFEKLKDKK